MQDIPHIPVLYREVIDIVKDIDDGVIVDCTLGYGGHSSMMLEYCADAKLIGIDQDITAIEFSTKRLEPFKNRIDIKKGRFSKVINDVIDEYEIKDIKLVLADIGVSSLQLDEKTRGFSFDSTNLDMRMDKDASLDASTVINTYSKSELERVLLDYGELRNYKKLAFSIIEGRPFSSAKDLSEYLKPHLPKGKKTNPATLLMQAIRIEVNDELGELKNLLSSIKEANFTNAKIAIISFHSLEDRIVKKTFASWAKSCICPEEVMRCTCSNNHSLGKIITKKPITAQDDELKQNPRSRSAKLRVFETRL